MKIRSIVLLIVLFSLSNNVFSQEQDSVYRKKNLLQRMDSITNWKIQKGRSTLMPFAAPSYSPETSLMLTLGGLYTFKLRPDDKL
ncbi:MAG: hypothetical protein JW731_13330, partial [Bacteroidales bacterium]|nr:hypothetical protein [Bacteroidales bacterium]